MVDIEDKWFDWSAQEDDPVAECPAVVMGTPVALEMVPMMVEQMRAGQRRHVRQGPMDGEEPRMDDDTLRSLIQQAEALEHAYGAIGEDDVSPRADERRAGIEQEAYAVLHQLVRAYRQTA
jgi:hypothetical protein